MTYLSTSNTQKTGREVNTTGINDPSSYVNMLSQTFEIEKDSEIAVESLKITRNGNIQLSSANNQFGVYIGHSLNGCGTDLEFDIGFPVNTFIRGVNDTLSPQSLTNNIKEGLMAGLGQHPNYVLRDSEYPLVELKNGSGEFQGFKYTILWKIAISFIFVANITFLHCRYNNNHRKLLFYVCKLHRVQTVIHVLDRGQS